MDMEEMLMELRESERNGSLHVFRKLITRRPLDQYSSSGACTLAERTEWQPILRELLKILTNTDEFDKEQVLLTAHAFSLILSQLCDLDEFKAILQNYFQLNNNALFTFDMKFIVRDINLFQLWIAHGYLQVNCNEIYTAALLELPFPVLYENCIRYTRYTHLAYKILEAWLVKTQISNYWADSHPSFEKKLETIIYSNWDNSIKEVSKQNSSAIFNQYLKITARKYPGFLEFAFDNCVNNVSWQNETKYIMLTEIFNNFNDAATLVHPNFILCIFTSLTKTYLRSGGLKLYNMISNKLNDEQWKQAFGPPISTILSQWGPGPQHDEEALQVLCTQWLEPTIKKRRMILQYLWELNTEIDEILFRSHLIRIASQINVTLREGNTDSLMDHNNEYIRLNSFAAHCHKQISLNDSDFEEHFGSVKRFLSYNVNTSSTYMRRGIVKYFRIWFLNSLKSCYLEPHYHQRMYVLLEWLHVFLLDCFEIGSCYQRKILGVKLYEIILYYMNERPLNEVLKNDRRVKNESNFHLKITSVLKCYKNQWFTSKESLRWLFKLILDPASDVRDISAEIILEYFSDNLFDFSEKMSLLMVAEAKLNSSKFYEAENGATIFRILDKLFPYEEIVADEKKYLTNESSAYYECYETLKMHHTYADYLLRQAHYQLEQVKKDILGAATSKSPFHGTLTAILAVNFGNRTHKNICTLEFMEHLMDLLDNAINHFLSRLSIKSNFDSGISSSFAEMGSMIDETVKHSEIHGKFDNITLSPAHQIVITCIWISLKISCELASEIGIMAYSDELVERSANLIVTVLTKCRHKGAIESAGLAIGRLTRKLVNVPKYSQLPNTWLDSLIDEQEINPNMTRRSAGLSIMFHQIVSNDNRHGRPLVHVAIQKLLNLLESPDDESPSKREDAIVSMKNENETYEDLPRAKYLHFIQRLVADSDLHAQVVPYLEKITIQSFKYLQSEAWTIRNASLQLFGAIVPRIAGQYTGGRILEFGNGYSVDHFVTHYSSLAENILSQLENAASLKRNFDTTLRAHAAIVHSLILLSRMSTGGSAFIDYSSKTYVRHVKVVLKSLFGSPVGHIRILAAKAYAALVAYPQLAKEYKMLVQIVGKITDVNQTHGYLTAIKYVGTRIDMENENANLNFNVAVNHAAKTLTENEQNNVLQNRCNIQKLQRQLHDGRMNSNICYVVEAMFLDLFGTPEKVNGIFLFNDFGQEPNAVLTRESGKPGFMEFIDTSTRLYAEYVNLTDDIEEETIHKILTSQCIGQTVIFLNHFKICEPFVQVILGHIRQMMTGYNQALRDAASTYFYKYLICKNPSFFRPKWSEPNDFYEACIQRQIISKMGQLGFDLVDLDNLQGDTELSIENIRRSFYKLCEDDENGPYLRAEYLPIMFQALARSPNCDKLEILKTSLELLKCEDSEIKNTARNCLAKLLYNSDKSLSSVSVETIYHEVFKKITLNEMEYKFSVDEIAEFLLKCTQLVEIAENMVTVVDNPFDHEDEPTSLEESKLLNIIFLGISQLEKRKSDSISDEPMSEQYDIIRASQKFQESMNNDFVDFTEVTNFLNCNYRSYITHKVNIARLLCEKVLDR